MSLASAFAGLALKVSAITGAPFYAGQIISQDSPGGYDDDGVWVPGDDPATRDCTVQIDAADWRMVQSEGYAEGAVRFIVLSASFEGDLDTDATIRVLTGPNAGTWSVSGLERDTAGIGWVGQGIEANPTVAP